MAITVREARAEDGASVASLMRQLNPDDPEPDPAAWRATFDTVLGSPHVALLVAVREARVVGTCCLNVLPNLTRSLAPYALIENVVVDRGCRRRGVGERLVRAAIDRAFDRGCYKVMLLSGRDASVHAFYESCGMDGDAKRAFVARADLRGEGHADAAAGAGRIVPS